MKKILSLVLALSLLLALCACGGTTATEAPASDAPATEAPATEAPETDAESVEVVVFAAASMEATLTEIAELYKEVAPNVTLTFTFDSSGTLKTQIEEGAVCDLFISAAQKQMNQLDSADTTGTNEGLDMVYSDTRIDLVENKVVLAVPDDNPAGIETFSDLATDKLTLLCLGNDDVPVGAYSLEILETLGIDIAQLEADGKVTYASNVSEVANQVKEGAVDCGIIYATDAFTYALTVVDQATADMCSQVIYPAAVMKSGTPEAKDAAQAFLDYLHTDESAIAVLEGVGFTVIQ
jgi:molybdate transport system substrate-binding protein